jgi:hypothetical protein
MKQLWQAPPQHVWSRHRLASDIRDLRALASIEMSRCCLVHSFTSGMTHEQDSRDDSRARPELRSFKATFNKIFRFD